MQSIDLHAHTTASDGSLTPTELVALAAQIGLSAVAVTDHDTVDGLAEALEAARSRSLECVPGIELSIAYRPGKLHLLGYFIDPAHPGLCARLRVLKENRARRNERMIAKIQSLGIPLTLEEVAAEAGSETIGRPHMALAMAKKGIVGSVQEAFDRYLADGALAHVPKDKIALEEGIALIRCAGGLAFVAHPHTLKLADDALPAELQRLREMGVDGMECYYSQYDPARTLQLLQMAREVGLLASGGSDFHGASKPHVRLGCVDGDRPAPAALLAAMKERYAERYGLPLAERSAQTLRPSHAPLAPSSVLPPC
jgi:predicted metal-dependent phosphoesterase TrpH